MSYVQYTLKELAEMTGARLIGDPGHLIIGVDALETAESEDASFLANPRYKEQMKKSRAGVICVDSHIELPEGKNFLISENPSTTFQTIAKAILPSFASGFSGIHPTAVIHPEAKIGVDVEIGPYVVIDRDASIGDRTCILAHVSIGSAVVIGEDCILYSQSVVREGCVLQNRVILQPGVVIGACGFGYATSAQGKHAKLEQLGIVVIEDDVEIGANTTIDRARFKDTRICAGTKIDNLVQIGHNVELGQDNLIVSQTGIAGSVKTGRNVIMGGQTGVVGHIEIGDGVIITSRGGIRKSMNTPGIYSGAPLMPINEFNRQQVHLRKIGDYVKRIEELEKRLALLTESIQVTQ